MSIVYVQDKEMNRDRKSLVLLTLRNSNGFDTNEESGDEDTISESFP